jgi:hypothetical protein
MANLSQQRDINVPSAAPVRAVLPTGSCWSQRHIWVESMGGGETNFSSIQT